MRKRFGQFNKVAGEGQLRPIFFPSLTTLDEWTGDRRLIESEGFSSRELPRPVFAQFAQSFGHQGSVPIGSLQEVNVEESSNVSGRGWLVDLPHVRDLFVPLIASESLFHNSVDLAEVEIRWGSDDWFDDAFWDMIMTKSKIAATTIVGVPAFPNAHSSLADFDDELVASFLAETEPFEINFAETKLYIPGLDDAVELTADGSRLLPSFDTFVMPEPDEPTPHTVTADRKVYGHVADWTVPHGGNGRYCPRPGSYNKFHAGSTLTDRGLVRTGVIFFLGGHPDKPLGSNEAHKAYGGVENAWARVTVTNGRFGPWYCGDVLPGMSDDAVELARATPISGHWVDDEMKAIVSCNVRGFDVPIPGSSLVAGRDGAIVKDGKVLELVASLHSVKPEPPVVVTQPAPTIITPSSGSFMQSYEIRDGQLFITTAMPSGTVIPNTTATPGSVEAIEDTTVTDDGLDVDIALLDAELAAAGDLPLSTTTDDDS